MSTAELPSVLTKAMESLDFVQWDRFAAARVSITTYGWIPRRDDRSDFVTLTWKRRNNALSYVTSSATYTELIAKRLYGKVAGNHSPCQRVEAVVPETFPNCVRLEP